MASRKDVEAGRAYVLVYIKDQTKKALASIASGLKAFSAVTTQIAGRLNQVSSIAFRAGALILGPMVAAVSQLEEAKKPLEDIKRALAEGLGRPLLPYLHIIRDIVVRFAEWSKANQEAIRAAARIAVALLAVGIAAKFAASMMMVMAAAATIASFGANAVALLLSPAGLIVLGVAALVALLAVSAIAWVRFTESGQRAAKSVANAFRVIRPIIDDIFKAFDSGRWELAGGLMGAAIAKGFADQLVRLKSATGMFGDLLFGASVEGAAIAANSNLASIRGAIAKLPGFDPAALPAIPGLNEVRPSQTAATTHEALGLTFGQGASEARRDERQLLKDIRDFTKMGAKGLADIAREMLRELRKRKAVVGP